MERLSVIQIRCEYDIGQDSIVFTTPQVAETWARVHVDLQGLDYNELSEECLIELIPIEVYDGT